MCRASSTSAVSIVWLIDQPTTHFWLGPVAQKVLLKQVRRRLDARLSLGGHQMMLAFIERYYLVNAHQTGYPIVSTHHPLAL